MLIDIIFSVSYTKAAGLLTGGESMEIRLSAAAEKLIDILNGAGFEGYAVGGCVRDGIMGRVPDDFDITTNASADEMKELFSGYRLLLQGVKHGTVAVVTDGGIVECTTYRIDGSYSDGRHPDKVRFSSRLSDDLSRRDFTINAVAYSKKSGTVDPFGGIDDIRNKIIRAIGDPDMRFNEDALRIMRAMRFSCVLGFSVEENTAESMLRNLGRLALVSDERITQEFEKLITGANIRSVLEKFGKIISEITGGLEITENVISDIEKAPNDFCVRLFALLRHDGEPLKKLSESRIILKKADRKIIGQLLLMKPPESRTEIKYLLSRFDKDAVRKYIRYLDDASLAAELESVLASGECFSLSQLEINGDKLMKLGFRGREIAKVKNIILNGIIAGNIKNSEKDIAEYLKTVAVSDIDKVPGNGR